MPKPITLSCANQGGITAVSNIFLDKYMPRANGEFLKIYLYLLRWLPQPAADISLAGIADIFLMTENDVIRAMKYWEQENLLELQTDAQGGICGIILKDILSETAPVQSAAVSHTVPAASDVAAQQTDTASPSAAYNMTELADFTANSDGEQLIFIIQQYLGHPLSQPDLSTIYYFYDTLGFSTDLIEYLFEYCISNGHTHMRYIEKVALGWKEQKIHSVDDAKAQTEARQRNCFAVLKAFGLGNRMPTTGEVDFINKWTRTYGFGLELVLEACRRTMMTVHTPSFEYTDKILSNWKEQGIYTMTEVLAADKVRSAQKAEQQQKAAPRTTSKPQSRPSSNKFHNFNQRSYDYAALEQKLAQKRQAASDDSNH